MERNLVVELNDTRTEICNTYCIVKGTTYVININTKIRPGRVTGYIGQSAPKRAHKERVWQQNKYIDESRSHRCSVGVFNIGSLEILAGWNL